jgi:thioredoxin-like negative regulator of GroEL
MRTRLCQYRRATHKDCSDVFKMRPISGLAFYTRFENSSTVDPINGLVNKIERDADDVTLRIAVAKLLLQVRDPEQTATHLKLAMKRHSIMMRSKWPMPKMLLLLKVSEA